MSTRARCRASIAAGVAAAAALAAPANIYADDDDGVYVVDPANEPDEAPYVPALRQPVRLAFGFDAGIGSFACTGCDEDRFTGLSLDLFAGAQVLPRLAIVAQSWGIFTYRPPGSRNAGWLITDFNTVNARTWVTPTVWVDAGVGPALLVSTAGTELFTEVAPAAAVAVGGEIEHRPDRGIELLLRLGYARFDDDTAGDLFTIAAAVGLHLF